MERIYIKLFIMCLLLISINYIKYPEQAKKKKEEDKYIVTIKTEDKTIKKELDEYLLGVVAGEMPATFEEEALKAQVVASRTFVMSRKLKVDNTTNTQVYLTDEQMREKWNNKYDEYKEKIQNAIQDTSNEVMTYNGEFISALFFSSCNGKTNNCDDYFEGGKPYLQSVESQWDLIEDKNNKKQKVFTKEELSHLFGVLEPSFQIMSYLDSGYVKEVLIGNKRYTGREVREILSLASSCFKIEYSKNKYTFITSGHGHGVGMSQYGAQGMAKENKDYKEILNHYYKNIKIESI